jgi:uncharacterized membrane protein YkvA (DUF1232 family)
MWWQALVSVAAGLVALYVILLGLLWRARRHGSTAGLTDAARLIPDIARLLRRLAADPALPRGVRIKLALLALYLISPIDLVPDFIPVLGYADDAVLVAVAVRSAIRSAGPAAIEKHWPGTPDGLRLILRVAGHRPNV